MKSCFKCGVSKPLSEFYRHAQMADGHLNKCKTCTKSDSTNHREKKITDPDWIEQERARCRVKQERHRRAGTAAKPSQATRIKWAEANKHKIAAERLAKRAVKRGELTPAEACENCSDAQTLEMHHHDYTRPLAVVWLCIPCHKVLHRKHKSVPVKRRKKI